MERKFFLSTMKDNEKNQIKVLKNVMMADLKSVFSDLDLLTHLSAFQDLLNHKPGAIDVLTKDFQS